MNDQNPAASQPVTADPAKNDEQVRQENERLSDTKQVVITHADNKAKGKVSKKQFEKVWQKRGWTVVEDGTGATPDQIETAAASGEKDQAAYDETVEVVPEATQQRPGRPERTTKEN